MKRVWSLYRVSTKKQVNTDDDIPVQRNACHEFVRTKEDWQITNEFYERGISGWSKKADERDELNVIREGAIKGEFDVLLVFMYDRLGRREDETPFVVQFLIEQGIEVWSVNEGQSKIEDHSDILVNFIRFWQSSGESKKTSIRVREAKKQLSAQGYFQGGPAPIGYKIIETDQMHWKNKDRHIKELAIDDEESEIIKLIFGLYVDRHMGYRKIVDYLNSNGYRNRDGKIFGVSTIQRILTNPIYIGTKRYEGFNGEEGDTQPYNEKLRIVTDDLFKQAEHIRNKRKRKLNEQDKSEIPLVGKLMFSGLAFCKYCGAKLSGNYLYRTNKYKGVDDYYKSIVYRYRCPLNKGRLNCNHDQNIWGANKYDTIIIRQVKQVLSQLDLNAFIAGSINQKKTIIKQKERNLRNLERELYTFNNQLEKLNGEIAKSLVGDSDFTPQQLSVAIGGVEKKIKQTTDRMNSLIEEMENERENYSDVNYMVNELNNWETKFDNADDDLKKAMLSRIIDKVHLGKEEVNITFNLTLQECLQQNEAETSIK
ncbi:recombinase family protein [Bacillus sp. T33-2]|uniref:recombinase family protein n=1 Tax=Bacillus sp. T33-2 TaxID=2054168 RepID=UPI000C77B301|nr:recombinase family protein [Bacillus sp. T33-2]PLR98231.1 site-specific recombinase [Bacillus sp. T33-2]